MSSPEAARLKRSALEELYAAYNQRCCVHPDPLEFLYHYDHVGDREVVGVVASALAFGRVEQVLKSASYVLERMGGSPLDFVLSASPSVMRSLYGDFRHRFARADDLVGLLGGMGGVIKSHGSLEACFASGLEEEHDTTLAALSGFADEIIRSAAARPNVLLPGPAGGSACKRLNLFLRWMVRKDEVDPGGWDSVSPSKLIVPLDTHMQRISLALGLTARKQADMRTALEITEAFRVISPSDPTRYDFSLTRLGMRSPTELEGFLSDWHGGGIA